MKIKNVYFDSNATVETVKEYSKDKYQKRISVYVMGYNSEKVFKYGRHGIKYRLFKIDKNSDNNCEPISVYFEGIQELIQPINENENMTLEELKNTADNLANPPDKMIIFWKTKNVFKQVQKAIYIHGTLVLFLGCFFSTVIKYIFKYFFGPLN